VKLFERFGNFGAIVPSISSREHERIVADLAKPEREPTLLLPFAVHANDLPSVGSRLSGDHARRLRAPF